MKNILKCVFVLAVFFQHSYAQEGTQKTHKHTEGLWLGTYTKYRISEKTFYYGEYHYRRTNNFIKDMGQVYLRFGLTYLINKNVEITGGIVTPLYWAPKQD